MKKLLVASLLFAGAVWAGLSDQYGVFKPSFGESESAVMSGFSNLAPGTVVSVINGDTGEYTNYEWDGDSYAVVETGYAPEYDGSNGGGGGSGDPPNHGGDGGGSGPTPPSGCYGSGCGTVIVGPVRDT